jgi:hypothetical protein
MGRNKLSATLGAVLIIAGACGGGGDDDDTPSGGGGGTTPAPGGVSGGGQSGASGMTAGQSGGSGMTAGMSGGPSGMGGAGMSGMGGTTAGSSGSAGSEPPLPTSCDTRGGEPMGMCAPSASGVFAIKTVVDVWWQDDAVPPLVDPGRDVITVYLMGRLDGVCADGKGEGIMKGCGTELPPFKSDANCDVFQIQFPDALWDSDKMPTFKTGGMTTGFEPGGMLNILTTTALIGIELMDPEATWPTPQQTGTLACKAGMGDKCYPDHDGDGKPGISITMGKIGQTYSMGNCGGFMLDFVYRGAPLDALNALADDSVRADKLQIGIRTKLAGGGEIAADCKSGVGDSTADFLDSRVFDCTKTDGMPCELAEAGFVDEQAPTYNILKKGMAPPTTVEKPATQGGGPLDQTPSKGPRSSLVRLGDLSGNFTCADVRGAAFPAL